MGLLITLLVIAYFTYNEIGYIAAVLSIIGFTWTLNETFELAFIHVILFVLSLMIAFGGNDES